jgi:non-ribosomal peptide synthetase component E (peptide arylation enzyme)
MHDWDGLVSHCQGRLADFKVPRYWKPIEALPKNAVNRVRKQMLDKNLADAFDRKKDD